MRVYTWFIEPLNSFTNEIAARELPDENFCRDIICEDGIARNLWACEYRFLRHLRDSRFSMPQLDFLAYVREGDRGKIRSWKHLFRNNRMRALLSTQV